MAGEVLNEITVCKNFDVKKPARKHKTFMTARKSGKNKQIKKGLEKIGV